MASRSSRNSDKSDKRRAFVKYMGQGLDQYESYRLAGFSTGGDGKSWRANARALTSRLRQEIDAERAKHGLESSRKAPQFGELTDSETADLLAQTREALRVAQLQSPPNVGAITKLLRQVERLTKRQARIGRPPSQAPAASAQRALMPGRPVSELVSMLLSEEEEAEIQRQFPAHIEIERAKWLRGEPNRYFEIAYPNTPTRTLKDGSTVFDVAEDG